MKNYFKSNNKQAGNDIPAVDAGNNRRRQLNFEANGDG